MKRWLTQHRRSALWVGATLLVPLYLFFSALGGLLAWRSDIVDNVDAIEPRIARLQGLIDNQDAMREALEAVAEAVSGSIYPASSDAQTVAAALQAEARQMLSETGMEVANSQVLPVRQREQFDYVAVKLVATGTLEQLEAGLAELSSLRPVVLIESFDAAPKRSRRDDPSSQTLTVSMQLLSLRAAT